MARRPALAAWALAILLLLGTCGAQQQAEAASARRLLQAGSSATIGTVQQLQAAALNTSITTFVLTAGLSLQAAVEISRPGRAVTITSTAAGRRCDNGDTACPTIDARGLSRAFNITGNQVAISGLRFANGRSATAGGCLSIAGTAQLSNMMFTNCTAGASGGAASVAGDATLTNVTVAGSSARGNGGAFAVLSRGTFTNVAISNARANGGMGGAVRAPLRDIIFAPFDDRCLVTVTATLLTYRDRSPALTQVYVGADASVSRASAAAVLSSGTFSNVTITNTVASLVRSFLQPCSLRSSKFLRSGSRKGSQAAVTRRPNSTPPSRPPRFAGRRRDRCRRGPRRRRRGLRNRGVARALPLLPSQRQLHGHGPDRAQRHRRVERRRTGVRWRGDGHAQHVRHRHCRIQRWGIGFGAPAPPCERVQGSLCVNPTSQRPYLTPSPNPPCHSQGGGIALNSSGFVLNSVTIRNANATYVRSRPPPSPAALSIPGRIAQSRARRFPPSAQSGGAVYGVRTQLNGWSYSPQQANTITGASPRAGFFGHIHCT